MKIMLLIFSLIRMNIRITGIITVQRVNVLFVERQLLYMMHFSIIILKSLYQLVLIADFIRNLMLL